MSIRRYLRCRPVIRSCCAECENTKLKYGEVSRKYELVWTVGEQSNSVEFATRGDLFNMIRALQKTGVTNFTARKLTVAQLLFD